MSYDDKKEADSSQTPAALDNPAKFVCDSLNDAKIASITKFSLKSEGDAKKINAAFNALTGILQRRQTECMQFANEAVAAYKLASGGGKGKGKKVKSPRGAKSPKSPKKPKAETLVLDVDHSKSELVKLGTQVGEIGYYLFNEEKALVSKTREFMYYEDFNSDARRQLGALNSTISGENDDLTTEKQAYKDSLQTVLPRLREAEKKLKKLTKSNMQEFKALRAPARIIINVVKCVAMMVGEITILNEKHFREWKDLKKIINIGLIEKMLAFDMDIKDDKQLANRDNISEKWLTKKDITHARAKQVNPLVAAKLVDWMEATIDLSRMRETVAPQELKIDSMSIKKRGKENQAKKLSKMIEENDKHMKKCHDEMKKLVSHINALREEISANANAKDKAAQEQKQLDQAY